MSSSCAAVVLRGAGTAPLSSSGAPVLRGASALVLSTSGAAVLRGASAATLGSARAPVLAGARTAVLAGSRASTLRGATGRGPAAAAGATCGPCPARRPRIPAARLLAPRRPGSLSHAHQPPASTLPRQAKRAARPYRERPSSKHVRRRPTLPRGPPRSTIGAEGLNFRVRNGTGCFPFAITAETLLRCHRPLSLKGLQPVWRPYLGNRTVDAKSKGVEAKPLGLLVPVSCTRCRASTSGLSTQSSSWGPYLVNPERDLILRRASRLDAFSGYPFRT
jgi:hypothetical protein